MGDGAFCKHLVATMLVAAKHPERVDEAPDLDATLKALSPVELRRLIVDAARTRPGLRSFLESRVPGLISPTVERRKLVDSSPYASARARAAKLLRSLDGMRRSEAYWHVETVLAGLAAIREEADLRAGGGFVLEGLETLGGLTAAYAEHWRRLDDSGGGPGAFWAHLGAVWADLLQDPDVTGHVRARWRTKLAGYNGDLARIGLASPFAAAIVAHGDSAELRDVDAGAPHSDEAPRRSRVQRPPDSDAS